MKRKFKLGTIIITAKASEALSLMDICFALFRYFYCDWGNVSDKDKKKNDDAVKYGRNEIFSSYRTFTGQKFWIITMQDQSYTTVMLPEEYDTAKSRYYKKSTTKPPA
jgi:hypothetical protein